MSKFLIDRIIDDEKTVNFTKNNPYLLAYKEFLRFFESLAYIEDHHLIISANFTYGWMPTKLDFDVGLLDSARNALNKAKKGQILEDVELVHIVDFINRSFVGASKLLHFVNPTQYGIIDSRVYRYIYGSSAGSQYKLTRTKTYRDYLAICREITLNERFSTVHQSMSTKVGYYVTPFRAVELIMFSKGT